MSASLDEAFFNYTSDAPFSVETNFYLLLDDNASGYTAPGGDLDAYKLIVDRFSNYSIIATDNSNGFDTFVDLYDRNGSFLSSSAYFGSSTSTGLTFTASDTLYYVVTRSAGSGFYTIRAGNNTVSEGNNVGQEVYANQVYNGALDYTSDSDHFFFTAEAGHTYKIAISTNISDIYLKVSFVTSSAYQPSTLVASSGFYTFTAGATGRYDLTFSANSFTSRGSYSFVAGDVTSSGGGGNINGTDGSDSLIGTSASEQILGAGGYDSVSAGGGNDTIDGGSGQSYLRGDEGSDSIVGGTAFDDANGNMGNDTVWTGAGDDYCVGGRDNDSLSGGAGYDFVYGNLGNDTCNGDDGNDVVRGGQDNDIVNGGNGDDFVSGDKGDDVMTGGAGADVFHTFGDAGIDRVTDFNLSQGDRVLLDPGTVFTVSQSGADTVVNMTGGGQMILVGVQMGALTPGWIFGN